MSSISRTNITSLTYNGKFFDTAVEIFVWIIVGALIPSVLYLLFWVLYTRYNPRIDPQGSKKDRIISFLNRYLPKYSKYIVFPLVTSCLGFIVCLASAFSRISWVDSWIIVAIIWNLACILAFINANYNNGQNNLDFSKSEIDEEDGANDLIVADNSVSGFWKRLKVAIVGYLSTIPSAFKKYKKPMIPLVIVITFLAFFIPYSSSDLCIGSHPISISSKFSRSLEQTYCPHSIVCFAYFTVPEDLTSSIIFNFHTRTPPIPPLYGKWYQEFSNIPSFCFFGTSSHASLLQNKDLNQLWSAYGNLVNASFISVRSMEHEEPRYVSWCDIISLTPNTTYFFVAGYFEESGLPILSSEFKVRTAGNGAFNFVSGGDMSQDDVCSNLLTIGGKTEPLFGMVGGDIAYESGFESCYRLWDRWLLRWSTHFTTPTGYSVPMLLAIGNHENGGFKMQASQIPFLSSYFPQQLGLKNVPVSQRQTYHSHYINNSTLILALDTWVVADMGGEQAKWIKTQLETAQNNGVPHKFSIYHVSIYPSVPDTFYAVRDGQKYWDPLFSNYSLTASFENHYHFYKRSKPILYGKEDPSGVVYLGDGSWGVVETKNIGKSSWYIEKIEQKVFIYIVEIDPFVSVNVKAVGEDSSVFDTWQKIY